MGYITFDIMVHTLIKIVPDIGIYESKEMAKGF